MWEQFRCISYCSYRVMTTIVRSLKSIYKTIVSATAFLTPTFPLSLSLSRPVTSLWGLNLSLMQVNMISSLWLFIVMAVPKYVSLISFSILKPQSGWHCGYTYRYTESSNSHIKVEDMRSRLSIYHPVFRRFLLVFVLIIVKLLLCKLFVMKNVSILVTLPYLPAWVKRWTFNRGERSRRSE